MKIQSNRSRIHIKNQLSYYNEDSGLPVIQFSF